MAVLSRRPRYGIDIWPGFVDALASILMVFIFLLLIFVLAQFFLTDTLEGRNQALVKLSQGINQLFQVLSVERTKSAELRDTIDDLTGRLQATIAERNNLTRDLAAAHKTITADRERIELQLRQIAGLQEDIAALMQLRAQLEEQVGGLASSLRQRATELTKQQGLTANAEARITLLNQQIVAVREQLTRLSAALVQSEATVRDQKVRIADLGQRLNVALADKVQQLSRYRSEFFGRLREVLGNRPDIRIVGDRFLLQTELLFASGSAEIGQSGQYQLDELAKTLKEIAREIPPDVNWILSIAGHTDKRPIRTAQFPSNWELSLARALSIVNYLIERGIPPNRLAAAGFGEFHPMNPADTAEAYKQNRRIELKLTQP